MSHQMKIEDKVYDKLDQLRGRGETFSQVIGSLLTARIRILELISVLEVQLKYDAWRRQQIEALTPPDRRGDSAAVSDVPPG